MRQHRSVAVVLIAAFVLPACGTLVGGSRQAIHIKSSPSGAEIFTNPATVSRTTPARLSLERKTSYTLTVSKEGYSKEEVIIAREMRGGVLVADIILFPIGVIVDAITGAWYRLTPDPVEVRLSKLAADSSGPDEIAVTVATRHDGESLEVEVEATSPVQVEVSPR